ETDALACTGRLVHLPVHECSRVDNARLAHLEVEVVAFACALTHAAEHRLAAVLLRDVVDQLHDHHRLAHAGAAEQAGFAALHVRCDQIDDLDARLEDFRLWLELRELRRFAVNRPTLDILRDIATLIDRLTQHVDDAAERSFTDGYRDR